MKQAIIAGLLTLAMTGLAYAAPTLTLTGSRDASNWYVWASVSQGDNYGLAFVSFKISGVNPASQSLKAPQVRSYKWDPEFDNGVDEVTSEPLPPGGWVEDYKALFSQQRNAHLVVGSTNHSYEHIAGMDIYDARAAIRGAGQGPVSFQYTKNTGETVTYSLPASLVNNDIAPGALLIAQGALLPGTAPGFNLSLGYNANVFADETGSTVLDTGGVMVWYPEPTTLALLGLGGIATLLRRRRK
jgi:hypothetical protein